MSLHKTAFSQEKMNMRNIYIFRDFVFLGILLEMKLITSHKIRAYFKILFEQILGVAKQIERNNT